MQEAKSAPVTE